MIYPKKNPIRDPTMAEPYPCWHSARSHSYMGYLKNPAEHFSDEEGVQLEYYTFYGCTHWWWLPEFLNVFQFRVDSLWMRPFKHRKDVVATKCNTYMSWHQHVKSQENNGPVMTDLLWFKTCFVGSWMPTHFQVGTPKVSQGPAVLYVKDRVSTHEMKWSWFSDMLHPFYICMWTNTLRTISFLDLSWYMLPIWGPNVMPRNRQPRSRLAMTTSPFVLCRSRISTAMFTTFGPFILTNGSWTPIYACMFVCIQKYVYLFMDLWL